jgi:RNA-directed DNA polymerase
MSAVYEADFCGFSCGFQPGRDPHMALDALQKTIMSQRVKRGLFRARPIAAD